MLLFSASHSNLRAVSFLVTFAIIMLTEGCQKRHHLHDISFPKETAPFVLVAKSYAQTNNCRDGTVWEVTKGPLGWHIFLEANEGENYSIVVSTQAEVLFYFRPR